MQSKTIYINFKGGIISPGYLKQLLQVAAEVKVQEVRFGLRQQMIFAIDAERFSAFQAACVEKNIAFHTSSTTGHNLVSSYAGANIFSQESWLSEGIYKDVFDLFTYTPALKLNICDGKQSFTPLFTGHLNWVSSDHLHYWFLYLRFPGSGRIFCWPELVYTNDLAAVSQKLESFILSITKENTLAELPNVEVLLQLVKETLSYISMPLKEKLNYPAFHLPYYEGFNKEGNSYWLGIYRRDESFPVKLLAEICAICLQSKIGELYVTTWKSILIKGIQPAARVLWDHVLGKYRINVRHAANELNWQVEDGNEDALILKRHVIRYFDKEDVRTYGLCFAVKMFPASVMFGSVIIRKQERRNASQLKSADRFDILYKKHFNPNGTELVMFREGIEKDHLGVYLVSICKYFYEKENANGLLSTLFANETAEAAAKEKPVTYVYQCGICLTVCDYEPGNPEMQLPPMPVEYECPLCGTGKEGLIKRDQQELYYGGVNEDQA